MQKNYSILIFCFILLISMSVYAQGGRDGQLSTAMATCQDCSFTLTNDTVTYGNWGSDFTTGYSISYHEFYINPTTYSPTSVYLTFLLNEQAGSYYEGDVFDDNCTVTHSYVSTPDGMWHHYEWTNITGAVPTATPMVTFQFFNDRCPSLGDSLWLDIATFTDSNWTNQFGVVGEIIYPGTINDGYRQYEQPEAKLTVVSINDQIGDTIAFSHEGGIVDVPIWLDTLNFAPYYGYTFTVGISTGLHFESFSTTYYSGAGFTVDSATANELTITRGYQYNIASSGPYGDVQFGTLSLFLDPSETDEGNAYKVWIKDDHTLTGCLDFYATGNSSGDSVFVAIPELAASWKIGDISVCKGTQNASLPFYIRNNAPLLTDNTTTSVNAWFTIDISDLNFTSYDGITTAFPYNGDTLYWKASIDGDFITISEDFQKISTEIVASDTYQKVGELIVDISSTAGTDIWPFEISNCLDSRVTFLYDDTLCATDDSLYFDNGTAQAKTCGGGPRPGCPALYVWSGENYILEDFVLTHSQNNPTSQAEDDYLPIGRGVVEENGQYKLQIREFENEITFLDDVELIVVDYPTESNVNISVDGEVLAHNKTIAPIKAVDQDGVDVLDQISREDGILYKAEGPGSLILTYIYPEMSEGDSRFGIKPMTVDQKRPEGNATAWNNNIWGDDGLYAEFEDGAGNWSYLGGIPPREHSDLTPQWSFNALSTNASEAFRVRISWQYSYEADIQPLEIMDVSNVVEHRLRPIKAEHSSHGKIAASVSATDDEIVTIVPGELIDLVFQAPERIRGQHPNRAFFFKSHGYYTKLNSENTLPTSFELSDNFPNPFNPSTNIWLSIPQKQAVKLKIYNLLGQDVKTVFSGELDAGRHLMTWEGDDNNGKKVASGVYFYRLESGDFTQSKKMLLIK